VRNRLIGWLVLLLVGFLGGFIPQYLKMRRARSETTSVRQQLSSCELAIRLSELRDTASLTYLEATKKNYGIAGQYAARLFNESNQLAGHITDVALRKSIDELLQSRDAITAGLAKGDPSIVPELQTLLTKAENDLKR
jgi:hypothetical protein